jgi:hypothetical protein
MHFRSTQGYHFDRHSLGIVSGLWLGLGADAFEDKVGCRENCRQPVRLGTGRMSAPGTNCPMVCKFVSLRWHSGRAVNIS